MSRVDRAPPPRGTLDGPSRRGSRPSIREAIWGFVFIGPWLIGLAAVHRRPDRSPRSSMSLTNFDLLHPETDAVRRPRQLHPADDATRLVAQSLIATFKFAAISIPLTMVASLGVRAAAEPPAAAGQGRAPDARLHADDDPARRQHAGLDRLPEHRDRLAEQDPRAARHRRARLDQQRDVDLPGPDADRPVGDRQLHGHQHRRPAVRARPSCTRRPGSTAPARGRRCAGSRSR